MSPTACLPLPERECEGPGRAPRVLSVATVPTTLQPPRRGHCHGEWVSVLPCVSHCKGHSLGRATLEGCTGGVSRSRAVPRTAGSCAAVPGLWVDRDSADEWLSWTGSTLSPSDAAHSCPQEVTAHRLPYPAPPTGLRLGAPCSPAPGVLGASSRVSSPAGEASDPPRRSTSFTCVTTSRL